ECYVVRIGIPQEQTLGRFSSGSRSQKHEKMLRTRGMFRPFKKRSNPNSEPIKLAQIGTYIAKNLGTHTDRFLGAVARSLGRSLQWAGESPLPYQSAQRLNKWPSGSESYGSTPA